MEPLKTFEFGSKIPIDMTAMSRLDWRRQCLQAHLFGDCCKWAQTHVTRRCSWQTSQLEELRACREHEKEKKQRCLTVSSMGGWEDGCALNSKNDHRRRSHLQGKVMSCLDSLGLTNLEHIQLSRSQKQGCTAQEKRQKVPRGSLKGTVETMNGTTYYLFPLLKHTHTQNPTN